MSNQNFGSEEFRQKALDARKKNKLLRDTLGANANPKKAEFYTATHIQLINAWNDYCAEKTRIEKGILNSFTAARNQLSLMCKLAIKRRAELLELSKSIKANNYLAQKQDNGEETNSENLEDLNSLNTRDDENFEGVVDMPSTSSDDKNND